MKLDFFNTKSEFQNEFNRVETHYQNERLILERIQKAFAGRVQIQRESEKSIELIINDLIKQGQKVVSPAIKQSIEIICRDWMNSSHQNLKLMNEYSCIAKEEIQNLIIKQSNKFAQWKNILFDLEKNINRNVNNYIEIESEYADSQKELIKQQNSFSLLQKKNKNKEKLINISSHLFNKKNKFNQTINQIKSDMKESNSQLGDYFQDLAMKNFILQVEQLKNREYDIDIMIKDFKAENPKKFNYNEDNNNQYEKSKLNIDSLYLPFDISLPQNKFFSRLENQFYKNVHYELLFHPKNNNNKFNFNFLGEETVILSKLLENKPVSQIEYKILENLSLKEYPDVFINHFLYSFSTYKKDKMIVSADNIKYFINNILYPIFNPLQNQNNHLIFYRLFRSLQKIQILTNPDIKPIPFTEYINSKSFFIYSMLGKKDFWNFSLNKIFKKIIMNSSKNPNKYSEIQNNIGISDINSQKSITLEDKNYPSVYKPRNSHKFAEKKMLSQSNYSFNDSKSLLEKNLLSCKYFLNSPSEFTYVMNSLQNEFKQEDWVYLSSVSSINPSNPDLFFYISQSKKITDRNSKNIRKIKVGIFD